MGRHCAGPNNPQDPPGKRAYVGWMAHRNGGYFRTMAIPIPAAPTFRRTWGDVIGSPWRVDHQQRLADFVPGERIPLDGLSPFCGKGQSKKPRQPKSSGVAANQRRGEGMNADRTASPSILPYTGAGGRSRINWACNPGTIGRNLFQHFVDFWRASKPRPSTSRIETVDDYCQWLAGDGRRFQMFLLMILPGARLLARTGIVWRAGYTVGARPDI